MLSQSGLSSSRSHTVEQHCIFLIWTSSLDVSPLSAFLLLKPNPHKPHRHTMPGTRKLNKTNKQSGPKKKQSDSLDPIPFQTLHLSFTSGRLPQGPGKGARAGGSCTVGVLGAVPSVFLASKIDLTSVSVLWPFRLLPSTKQTLRL